MPPRWSRKPDRKTDPDFRRLDDRMNFATHVAIFAATNSGLWFFRVLGEKTSELSVPGGLPNTPQITSIWAAILLAHAMYVFAIAKYSTPSANDP
jgi:2TM domain